jgi:hypothetical protein
MNFPTVTRQRREGRPSLVATEVANKIIEALRKGSYIRPAGEAAGVSHEALRNWILKGEADATAGVDSEYAQFRDRLTRESGRIGKGQVETREEPSPRVGRG